MAEPRLLIRLGSLGDVVLATAAAHALREADADAPVDVLVKEEWAEIWAGHPAVREVLSLCLADRDLAGLRRWAKRLRERGYGETVDLQDSPRTRGLAVLAGLSPVRRPRRQRLRRRALVTAKRWGPPPEFSVGKSFVAAARAESRALPSVHPHEAARRRAAELIPAEGLTGLVPGAKHHTKRWPLERFVEVGRALAGPVPVFFGPGEDGLLAEWEQAWPQRDRWVAVRENLSTVAACLERLGSVVVNDTGLMHLAAAVGTPVVALFGPTVRSFGFAPLGPGHRILETEGLGCRPCALHGGPRCPREHFRCMLEIDTSRVIQAVERSKDPSRSAGSP